MRRAGGAPNAANQPGTALGDADIDFIRRRRYNRQMDLGDRLDFYFMPVNLKKLPPHSVLSFDLYLRAEKKYILYRSRNIVFSMEDIQRLIENKIETLFIHYKDRKNFRTYLESNVETILKAENVPVEKKAEALYESAINVVEDVFQNPRSGESIKRSKEMVNHTVDFILSGPQAFVNLLKIREHDYYTYTHSVNVCTFLVSLAQFVGIGDAKTLKEIGEGGLLHDLGKSQIPLTLINKPGGLTGAEWEVMRRHPQFGVEIARQTRDISDVSVVIIGQHHEKLSGRGYPRGLAGSELNLFARMASIVDVYDAVTTNRSYSQARTPLEAAQLLLGKLDEFDEQIVMKFIKMITVK